jgi:hypothetical protein
MRGIPPAWSPAPEKAEFIEFIPQSGTISRDLGGRSITM